ncbi:MAG: CopD family protein [Candidatus Thiodiazotropha sp.]
MSIAMTLHIIGVIIWVGGMFFAHMVLRPALNDSLEAPQRLSLLLRVFDGFFPWVWVAVIAIVASGFWMLFMFYEDNIGLWLGFMTVVGILMSAIFVFIYAIPYQQIGVARKEDDKPKLVEAVSLIRQLILINLTFGMLVTVVAVVGKYGLLK